MDESRVIIALDFDNAEKVYGFLDLFGERKLFVKIGMELFYAEGPEIVRQIKARGHRIFLDLKLHDIPNTVKKAMRVLSSLDVDLCNLPLLIAVTQLTSTDERALHEELLINRPMPEVVLSYAKLAEEAGLDGVVCSPLEAGAVHERCGSRFLTVTPGVRFADGDRGDQKRVMTPAEARKNGSDYIVVGRPITAAENPVEAYERCVREFSGNE